MEFEGTFREKKNVSGARVEIAAGLKTSNEETIDLAGTTVGRGLCVGEGEGGEPMRAEKISARVKVSFLIPDALARDALFKETRARRTAAFYRFPLKRHARRGNEKKMCETCAKRERRDISRADANDNVMMTRLYSHVEFFFRSRATFFPSRDSRV